MKWLRGVQVWDLQTVCGEAGPVSDDGISRAEPWTQAEDGRAVPIGDGEHWLLLVGEEGRLLTCQSRGWCVVLRGKGRGAGGGVTMEGGLG